MPPAKSQEWETPQDLFDKLNAEFNFTLDACATAENAKCKTFYTKSTDGLKQDWNGRVYCNPPYGREIPEWVLKAKIELIRRRAEIVVMLLPSRTGTSWFHGQLYNTKGVELRFLQGRLKFGKNSAPFDSMIVILRRRNVKSNK